MKTPRGWSKEGIHRNCLRSLTAAGLLIEMPAKGSNLVGPRRLDIIRLKELFI